MTVFRYTCIAVVLLTKSLFGQTWNLDPNFDLNFKDHRISNLRILPVPDSTGWIATGGFNSVSNIPIARVAKLNASLVLEPSFRPLPRVTSEVIDWYESAAPLQGGRVVVSVRENPSTSRSSERLVVLDSSGKESFPLDLNSGEHLIRSAVVTATPDGGALAHYRLIPSNNLPRGSPSLSRLIRINPVGNIDPSFQYTSAPNKFLHQVYPQSDGSVFVTGTDELGSFLRKLKIDGSPDDKFDVELEQDVVGRPVVVLENQNVLVVGDQVLRFDSVGLTLPPIVPEIEQNAVITKAMPLSQNRWVVQYYYPTAADGRSRALSRVVIFHESGRQLSDLSSSNLQVRNAELLGMGSNEEIVIRRAVPVRVASSGSNAGTGTEVVVVNPSSIDHSPPIAADEADLDSDTLKWLDPSIAALAPNGTILAESTAQFVTHWDSKYLSIVPSQFSNAVWISGDFDRIHDTAVSSPQRLLESGILDPSFKSSTTGELLLELTDGRIIIETTEPSAEPGEDGLYRLENRWVMLGIDGEIESDWHPPAELPRLREAQVTKLLSSDSSGRIYGARWTPNGFNERNLEIFRLLRDGQFDENWQSPTFGQISGFDENGEKNWVSSNLPIKGLTALLDGRIQVAGIFKRVDNVSCPGVIRLNSSGRVDISYVAQDLVDDSIQSGIAVYPDGSALGVRVSNETGKQSYTNVRWTSTGLWDHDYQQWPTESISGFARQQKDGTFLSGFNRWHTDGRLDLLYRPAAQPVEATLSAATSGNVIYAAADYFNNNRVRLYRFEATQSTTTIIYAINGTPAEGDPLWLQTLVAPQDIASITWYKDGETMPDASTQLLHIDRLQFSDSGRYTSTIRTTSDQTFTANLDINVQANTTRLTNLSARGFIRAARPMIAGFVIGDAPTTRLLLRAVGKGMWGLQKDQLLPRTNLKLFRSEAQLDQDIGGILKAPIQALASRLGAFPPSASGLAFDENAGAALDSTLPPSAYTVHASSDDSRSGIGLVEIYSASEFQGAPPIKNLSIRGSTDHGNKVLTAGFVLQGNGPSRVLIRAVGPGLQKYGVDNTITTARIALFSSSVQQPFLEVSEQTEEAKIAARQVGAFELDPASADSATVVTLSPGPYTVQVPLAQGAPSSETMIEIYYLGL